MTYLQKQTLNSVILRPVFLSTASAVVLLSPCASPVANAMVDHRSIAVIAQVPSPSVVPIERDASNFPAVPTAPAAPNRSSTDAKDLGTVIIPDCFTVSPYLRREDCAIDTGGDQMLLPPNSSRLRLELDQVPLVRQENVTPSLQQNTIPIIRW